MKIRFRATVFVVFVAVSFLATMYALWIWEGPMVFSLDVLQMAVPFSLQVGMGAAVLWTSRPMPMGWSAIYGVGMIALLTPLMLWPLASLTCGEVDQWTFACLKQSLWPGLRGCGPLLVFSSAFAGFLLGKDGPSSRESGGRVA